jgi:hypothetical protein
MAGFEVIPEGSIRAFLLADVLANLLQFESDRGNSIAPRPEMLPGEVPIFATQSGNRDGTLPFQEPDYRRHRVFGRNGDAHVHMVRHEVPFENLAFLLSGQRMEDLSQLLPGLPKDDFPSALGHEYYVILAVPFGMG